MTARPFSFQAMSHYPSMGPGLQPGEQSRQGESPFSPKVTSHGPFIQNTSQ